MENLLTNTDSSMMMDKEEVLKTILAMKGVDGYALIDQAYEMIRSELPEGIDRNEILAVAKQIIVNQRPLGMLDHTVLLTEKGVILLAAMDSSYLFIVAGYEQSVDVPKLIDLVQQVL
jgi:hypothetical protein